MAVTPADLLAPNGMLESSLFPGEDPASLETRLNTYIVEAAARTDNDAAVKAWAYHRAFLAVYIRLTSKPASVEFEDQGSHSYLITQIENVYRLSQEYRDEYDRLVAAEADVVGRNAGTTSQRVDFTW